MADATQPPPKTSVIDIMTVVTQADKDYWETPDAYNFSNGRTFLCSDKMSSSGIYSRDEASGGTGHFLEIDGADHTLDIDGAGHKIKIDGT